MAPTISPAAEPAVFPNENQIQANILTPAAPGHASYYFLSIEDPQQFCAFLRKRSALIAMERDRGRDWLLLVGFTAAGLRRLDANLPALFPEAFVEGMAQRCAVLGDAGASAPELWEGPFGTGRIHAVLCVLDKQKQSRVDELWQKQVVGDLPSPASATSPAGSALLWVCRGHANEERVDLFGFRDGISQPEIEGVAKPAANGEAPIALGEFVLGYPDELERENRRAAARRGAAWRSVAPDPLLANGSYMVFRKLRQDVQAFQASFAGADGPRRAAEALGRWSSGEPLRNASTTPPTGAVQEASLNDFSYAQGENCGQHVPRGSHIRRANPRRDAPDIVQRSHRLLRRGLRYDDGPADRGVLFMCFNARIEDQFEFVQSLWLNNGNAAGLPSSDVDAIGSSESPYVTVRGGEYFFMPSRSLIDAIAAGQLGAIGTPAPAPEDAYDLFAVSSTFAARLRQEDAIRRPVPGTGENLYFVGKHALVLEVLQNERRYFGTELYGARITEATGGRPMIVGLNEASPLRAERRALLRSALEEPSHLQIRSRQTLEQFAGQELAQRIREGRPVEVVTDIARRVSLAFVTTYLGVPVPAGPLPSEALVAVYFGRQSFADVPPPWKAAFLQQAEAQLQAGVPPGLSVLAFWTRVLFGNCFGNLAGAREIRETAKQAALELSAHLREEIARLRRAPKSAPQESTVLSRALEHCTDDEEVMLLVFELLVGGTETTVTGITNTVDALLDDPRALSQALAAVNGVKDGKSEALDRIIHEALRLYPVATMLPRRCISDGASIGSQPIERGALVCLDLTTASRDPAHFPSPDLFDAQRKPGNDLAFGEGPRDPHAPHACAGQDVALAQIRTVLCWLLGSDQGVRRFPGLRRAAGPKGRKHGSGLPDSLWVRMDPLPG